MASKAYRIKEGSLHEKFQASRNKIQIFGGGFGNGKTTGAVIKALMVAKDYPGCNILVARSTFPKLNATIRKEVKSWCPKAWIKRDVNSKENLIELTNGSIINFSYIAQDGKSAESSTSNLLSATYDLIVIDQIEDPEISHKDFLDLLGRLRGSTPYRGQDDTMPSSGPRWLICMCNPTRNWVYRELVKPLQDRKLGIPNEKLLVDEETNQPIIDLFEGSTYDNADNLPADFITTQESAYKGQMRQRFLLGEWGAYEGQVYPQYDASMHYIDADLMQEYFEEVSAKGFNPQIIEAYDHGIAKPACYGLWFTDNVGNTFLLDGFYEKELTIASIARLIKKTRMKYGLVDMFTDDEVNYSSLPILGDPAIFRRASGNSKTVGTTTSGLFAEHGIQMIRANNDVMNGIAKVQSYLEVDPGHMHPITHNFGAPRLFVSTNCPWFDSEISDYFWKKDTSGEYEDAPNDKNDHAMDMTKYALTNRPKIASLKRIPLALPAKYSRWREQQSVDMNNRNHRYGR